jgi:hypothetical protein
MNPKRRAGGLVLASLLLLSLSAVHCGGKIIGGGGSSGNGQDSGENAGACPVSHGPGPVVVDIGSSCDWGGASCRVAVPAGCGPGSTEDTTCECTGGSVVCPSFVPPPCIGPAPACPIPSSITAGGTCSGDGTSCMSAIPEYDCDGNVTGYASCTCSGGAWACAIGTPGCPPPPPPPPPPSTCAGSCTPGATCTATGAGVCGGPRLYTCLSSGTYDQGIDPCSAGANCVVTTSCGADEVCFCYAGSSTSTGHFVCMGGCDGG